MAILVISDASDDMLAHYDEVINHLEAAGHGQPAGRQFHVAARKEASMTSENRADIVTILRPLRGEGADSFSRRIGMRFAAP